MTVEAFLDKLKEKLYLQEIETFFRTKNKNNLYLRDTKQKETRFVFKEEEKKKVAFFIDNRKEESFFVTLLRFINYINLTHTIFFSVFTFLWL